MNTNTELKLAEADRLVRWILKNPGKWNGVANKEDIISSKHFADLLQSLLDAELYQIIIVLFFLNEKDDERHVASIEIEQVFYEIIAELWDKELVVDAAKRVIRKIKEIELTE